MAAKTGGIGAATTLGETFSGRQAYCWLSIAGKAVYDKLEDFFNLVGELLLEPQDKPQILAERLLQMALEDKARLNMACRPRAMPQWPCACVPAIPALARSARCWAE